MTEKLNQRQLAFVGAMLTEPNATRAYIQAGYKAKGANAEAAASRLLRNGKVKIALSKARLARSKRVEVDQDWVLTRLTENIERSMRLVPVFDSEGEPTGEHRYQGNVANKALELVGKHLGMFQESSGSSVNVNVNVDNHPKRDLSELTPQELDFYESMFSPTPESESVEP